MNDFEVHPIGTAQRLAELERDAARYCWLRNFYLPAGESEEWDDLDQAIADGGAALDAAIDAAMEQSK